MKWLLFCVLFAAPVFAETILVRTGEHAGFSRVVLSPAKPTPWSVSKSELGYRFKFETEEIYFDISRAFNLIPRDRIIQIYPGKEAASLDFVVKAGVLARSYEIANGVVVIDFSELPPEKVVASKEISQKLPKSFVNTEALLTPFYWRSVVLSKSDERPGTQPGTSSIVPALDAPKNSLKASGRVVAAEQQLLLQLSRAASQGLVTVDSVKNKLTDEMEANISIPPTEDVDIESTDVVGPLAYQVKTAMDRELSKDYNATDHTEAGAECLSDSDLNITKWVNADPPTIQIADARRDLVSEFDNANDSDVLNLAKVYLGLSFGAEAQAVLAAFNPKSDEIETLMFLAHVIDGLPVDQSSTLLSMMECDSAASMWALLGDEQTQVNRQVNVVAVQRAYSALPHELRLTLADPLIEKLILNKQPAAARLIRKIVVRTEPSVDSPAISDVRIDLAQGAMSKAEQKLKTIVALNGPDAIEALVMLVETQFETDVIIDSTIVENVAALAFEHRFADDNVKLSRALILATAASGQYSRAIDQLRRWSVGDGDLRHEVATQLFEHIVRHADDTSFLNALMENADLWNSVENDCNALKSAAERYLNLRFADQVIDILSHCDLLDVEVAKIIGRAHILRRDAPNALTTVQNFSGDDFEKIRAESFALLDQPENAAKIFMASDDNLNARRQAWKAGDWGLVSIIGSAEEQEALKSFYIEKKVVSGNFISRASPENKIGLIAQGSDLINESSQVRKSIDALLLSQ
jgi:hypothetical protein